MQKWRKLVLLLLIVAISAPWTYEKLNIPEPYECANGFRLDENFCGYPMSGIQIFFMLFVNMFGSVFRFIIGETSLREPLFSFLGVGLVLAPTMSLLLLIATKEKPFGGGEAAHAVVLSLSILIGVFVILSGSMRFMRQVWGVWLYLALLAGGLFSEIFHLKLNRKTGLLR